MTGGQVLESVGVSGQRRFEDVGNSTSLSLPFSLPFSLIPFLLPLSYFFPIRFPFPFPSLCLTSIGSLNTDGIWGALQASPARSGADPQQKSNLVHLALKSDTWWVVAPLLLIIPESY